MVSEKQLSSRNTEFARGIDSDSDESPIEAPSAFKREGTDSGYIQDRGLSIVSSEQAAQQNPMLHLEGTSEPIGRITSEGPNNEYIRIGHQRYLKSDLYNAFGGTLQPGLAPEPSHKFGNPAPLGLSGFAATTFVLSLINTKAQGVTIPNAIVGPGMFYGGLVQAAAGIWEIAVENTFGGTALCSYGGFWMSFSAFYIPWFGVQRAYEDNEGQLSSAIGFFLLAMSIFSMGLTICTMKSTVMFFLMFFTLAITFLLLAISEFTGSFGVKRAGGVFGIIVSILAWYNAFAGLATKENSYIMGHPVPLPTNEYTVTAIARGKHRSR